MCGSTSNHTSKITREVKRMTENNTINLYQQNRDLKQRCRELSQENLLLKSEIADMRITNIILGGA